MQFFHSRRLPVVAQRQDWGCKLRENSSTFHGCSFQRFFEFLVFCPRLKNQNKNKKNSRGVLDVFSFFFFFKETFNFSKHLEK